MEKSSGLYLDQTTGKRETLLSFEMSPRRWQKENGVQGRWKEKTEIMVGHRHAGCTMFLTVGEKF